MDTMIYVTCVCPICGQENEVLVRECDFYAWKNGKCAQDCFGYLSASDRELLISGLCYDCQVSIFGN